MIAKEKAIHSVLKQGEETSYCLYFHVNPIKQEVFYVGIGDDKRPYKTGLGRNIFWRRLVDKYSYEVVIIHKQLTQEKACILEQQYIKQID